MITDRSSLTESPPTPSDNREQDPGFPFAFRLSGILPLPESLARGEGARLSASVVHSVATALPPGARASFHHHRTPGGEIDWSLVGSELCAAGSLTKTLSCALAASGGFFRFESGRPCEARPWSQRVRLRPVTRRLPIHPAAEIGFGAVGHRPSPEHFCLPAAGKLRAPAFASLGALLQSAPCEATACVGLTRAALGEAEVALLHAMVRQMRDSPVPGDRAASGWLEQWMAEPSGWRLDCAVMSNEPLAEPFLQLLGGEVFGQRVEMLDTDAEEPAFHGLDLSACRHQESALPRLFPGGALLASLRQPRTYNQALPHLPAEGVLIGEVECQGTVSPLYLPTAARDRHLFAVGGTGCGKSTVLRNLISQDIAAGRGVALLDPHGDLFEQVLASIPPERMDDVVLLEPGRGGRVPGLNFLEVTNGPLREVQRNFVINELFGIFDQLWDMSHCGGPMFEVYFRNGLLLLMHGETPGTTLTELPLVFEDRAFRERLKAACTNPLVTGFWTNQAEKAGGEGSLQNMAPYITSKLNGLTHSSVLRPIIGQARTTLDFRGMLAKRGIFLANLSKGLIGNAEARLLGMLLLGRIFAAAMERAVLPPHRRAPFSVYVDETQNFVTPTLASALAEARKFGLSLHLGAQNLAQLAGQGPNPLLEALLGNVGTFIAFRLGAVDAQTMALYTRPAFEAATLARLPNYHAVGRILTPEGPLDPLVFRTLPSQPAVQAGVAADIRRRQRRYTRPIAAVEAEIRARREMRRSDGPPDGERKTRTLFS